MSSEGALLNLEKNCKRQKENKNKGERGSTQTLQVTQALFCVSWGRDVGEWTPVQACQRDQVPLQGHPIPEVHQP